VVPSRQLSVLRAGLEQQLKELPPGKKADAIRRLLDQLSNAPQASEAKTPSREGPSREGPSREGPAGKVAPPQRTTVERMLAEIEFRVVLQQYEHILVRLRDLQIERALLEAEGLAEADLRAQQAIIDARATILDQLRGQVALQIGEMHDAMRALGFDGGMAIPAERAAEAPASIGGICLDDATGEPLAGVQVVVQRQSANAATGESKSESFAVSKSDLQGRFNIAEQSEQLKRENVSLRLVFIKPGYQRSELTVDRSTPGLSQLQQRMKRGSSNTNRP
jgi:5-hydroxyisourate hydrolase-like protein (transthyretin family)